MQLPRMMRVRQKLARPVVSDIAGTIRQELSRLDLRSRVGKGQRVAVTAGSRGIANTVEITREVIRSLKSLGLEPFIVPAMGSHGGGTAEGQREVLRHYGLTEDSLGAPIRATTETVTITTTKDGIPVHINKAAAEADHIVVVNRVKQHTLFTGEIQSGLIKMLLIGLGGPKGATVYHRAAVKHSFDRIARTAGAAVLGECNVLFGLGIVENAYDETAQLAAVEPCEMIERERELLAYAKRIMPRLPFDPIDALIVDWMGKDISGTGMDAMAIGRRGSDGPTVIRVFPRNLTDASEGNALGVGFADVITRKLADRIDHHKMYVNCRTSMSLEAVRIPMTVDTEEEALAAALSTVGLVEPRDARVVWIRDTLHLAELEVSEALAREVPDRADLESISALREMRFDGDGDLLPLSMEHEA